MTADLPTNPALTNTAETTKPTTPALPFALPIVSSLVASSSPIPAPSSRLVVGNTPRERRAWSRTARVGRADLGRLADSLSERDWTVLRSVADHRFLTTGHIEGLYFLDQHASAVSAKRTARRVLQRLCELRVLARLERRVGGVRAGSAAYIWVVGSVGDRLLRRGTPDRVRRRVREPSERFLKHCLAIADAHLALVTAARSGSLELLDVQLEPACWRPFLGIGGAQQVLESDLFAVTASGNFEDRWFLEVDLGSEHLPTIIGKCAVYQAYRQTGTEQASQGVFPRVVWIVPTERRAIQFDTAFARARDIDRSLFRIVQPGGLIPLIMQGAA